MSDAATIRDFALPDLGEGLEEGEIVAWHVETGDQVALNETLAEVETAKALVAIPSPFAGTVVERLAEVGATVEVGSVIVRIRTQEVVVAGDLTPPANASDEDQEPLPVPLVGYGATSRQDRASVADERSTGRGSVTTDRRVLAKPPVRKLARELGIDLAEVAPTGDGGVVTRADVEAAAGIARGAPPHAAANGTPAVPSAQAEGTDRRTPSVDPVARHAQQPASSGIGFRGRRPGDVEPIRAVRKRIVEKMERSRRDIPAAAATIDVDVTRMWQLREDLTERARRDGWDVKITPFVMLMRATVIGLRRFPTLNARLVDRDPDRGSAGEIHLLEEINLGFAVDTDRGLVVPNIKQADTRSLIELAADVERLSRQARDGTVEPAAVTGGTFTVNNYGVFGNDDGDPIINHPEAGILGIGAIRERPWVVDSQIAVRRVATLRVSFDHRVCDGAEGGRFLAYVAAMCEEPARILLHG